MLVGGFWNENMCPFCGAGRCVPLDAEATIELIETGQVEHMVTCACGGTWLEKIHQNGRTQVALLEAHKALEAGRKWANEHRN